MPTAAGSVLAAGLATLVGGLVALRFGARLTLLAAFAAGSLVAVALLDLLPEALDLSALAPPTVLLVTSAGFLFFYVLERLAIFHAHPEESAEAEHTHIGVVGAAGVGLHSMLDGVALGLAAETAPATALAVTVAVMLHKLTDGTSTVGLILIAGHPRAEAYRWLGLAALAPLVGFGFSQLASVPEPTLGVLLAFFSGTFLYLGASHLLPEAHHHEAHGGRDGRSVALSTLVGFAFVVLIGELVGRA
jgi:ZIP family zinc transporter